MESDINDKFKYLNQTIIFSKILWIGSQIKLKIMIRLETII